MPSQLESSRGPIFPHLRSLRCLGAIGPSSSRGIRHLVPRGSISLSGLIHEAYLISAFVSFTSLSSPASGAMSPRITPVMISRCVRHTRTELPPG
jgi:hypothetical protein